jgi:hypothetical protein
MARKGGYENGLHVAPPVMHLTMYQQFSSVDPHPTSVAGGARPNETVSGYARNDSEQEAYTEVEVVRVSTGPTNVCIGRSALHTLK